MIASLSTADFLQLPFLQFLECFGIQIAKEIIKSLIKFLIRINPN